MFFKEIQTDEFKQFEKEVAEAVEQLVVEIMEDKGNSYSWSDFIHGRVHRRKNIKLDNNVQSFFSENDYKVNQYFRNILGYDGIEIDIFHRAPFATIKVTKTGISGSSKLLKHPMMKTTILRLFKDKYLKWLNNFLEASLVDFKYGNKSGDKEDFCENTMKIAYYIYEKFGKDINDMIDGWFTEIKDVMKDYGIKLEMKKDVTHYEGEYNITIRIKMEKE